MPKISSYSFFLKRGFYLIPILYIYSITWLPTNRSFTNLKIFYINNTIKLNNLYKNSYNSTSTYIMHEVRHTVNVKYPSNK